MSDSAAASSSILPFLPFKFIRREFNRVLCSSILASLAEVVYSFIASPPIYARSSDRDSAFRDATTSTSLDLRHMHGRPLLSFRWRYDFIVGYLNEAMDSDVTVKAYSLRHGNWYQ